MDIFNGLLGPAGLRVSEGEGEGCGRVAPAAEAEQRGRARRVAVHGTKFHFAIVHMSRGLVPRLSTTEGSKPECIRQSWQRGSRRLAQ